MRMATRQRTHGLAHCGNPKASTLALNSTILWGLAVVRSPLIADTSAWNADSVCGSVHTEGCERRVLTPTLITFPPCAITAPCRYRCVDSLAAATARMMCFSTRSIPSSPSHPKCRSRHRTCLHTVSAPGTHHIHLVQSPSFLGRIGWSETTTQGRMRGWCKLLALANSRPSPRLRTR